MYRDVLSVLLAFSVGMYAPMNALQAASPPPQKMPALQGEQRSDSVPQSSSQQPGTQASPASSDKLVLADGTPVRLKFTRAVVSSLVIAGEKVPLEVAEPVLVGNLAAIPQRSLVEATVTMAQAGRSMGRGGNLELKIENVRLADGELVPVRALKEVKAGGYQPLVVAGMAAGMVYWLASPLTFLAYARGKSATIPAGAEITAYIAGDFPLDASKFQTAGATQQPKDVPK